MVEDKKEGEFLTLSFLEELRHLCFKIGYKFGDFGNELDNLRLSLANPNLHDFQKELVGRLHGRKPKLTLHQRQEALSRRQAGEALTDIGRSYDVSHSTISRLK